MNLDLGTDRSLVRAAARSIRYLHLSFTAPTAPAGAIRRPMTVAFVLDRSGSMTGEKIAIAQKAIDTAIRMLKPEDLFSVVVYDHCVDVLVATMHATADARRRAADLLNSVHARGSTDLCTGWLRGCEQVARGVSPNNIARCLLLSDGLANVGVTDPNVLADRAGQLRDTHVVTSTFGVGAGFDERLMASLARAGGGNYHYIEHARQIEDVLTSELGEALDVVARRAVLNLDLPAGVDAELMHDFRSEVSGRRMRIELNDLISGQDVSLIVKLRFPHGEPGNHASVCATLTSEDGEVAGAGQITWTFADHLANDTQFRERSVDRLVAGIYAARARRDAVERNRAGDYPGAAHLLRATRERILSYAGTDGDLNAVASKLEQDVVEFGSPMDPTAWKHWHWNSWVPLLGRDLGGRAQRRWSPDR